MTHDKLQDFLLKYGSTPQASAKWFGIGIFLFFTGMIGIYLSVNAPTWISVVSFATLVVGVLIALKGYIGILFNRLAYFRHNAAKNKAKYKHIK
ncbi:hypothetical protein Q4575_06345 [Psychrosphaera sp. 1_MG-2023]|uniref:hypothetical protein n=1 Tax=Psychrosphaera sp. 1_MG-2023 TaxID=3062643 RepID=UPI0026E15F7D|nr:hypothetical protein [Psychrosphaera sp. 1_MG-2023]MDO6719014.1 hypothetical protein [Psychrosphaera sp. 1_MG-2023]